MEVEVLSLDGTPKEKIRVKNLFSEPIREDLIQRAVLSERSKKRQPYGTNPMAGKRTSAHYHGRRHDRWTMMNREMARLPRLHGKIGYLAYRARFAPQTVKGRVAHPPKVEKVWAEKINKKEWLKALYSAVSSTINKHLIFSRGHIIDESKKLPLVLDDSFEKLKKTKDVLKVLYTIGLEKELERVKNGKKERAGKGSMRGRRYKKVKGPLIIIGKDGNVSVSAKNIEGVDISPVDKLTVEHFAPGTHPGRLCIWTKSALLKLDSMAG